MPLDHDLINLLDGDCRIELVKILDDKDKDVVLRLPSFSLMPLNVANIGNYFRYPQNVAMVLRKKRKIEALIIGIPVEKFYEDETFPDPDIGKKNTFYTAIIAYLNGKAFKSLEDEYRKYLSNYGIRFESRHLRLDWVKGTSFEVVKVFPGWLVSDSPVAYCKHKIA